MGAAAKKGLSLYRREKKYPSLYTKYFYNIRGSVRTSQKRMFCKNNIANYLRGC